MDQCIFCKIINEQALSSGNEQALSSGKEEIPKKFIYESEDIVAFPDINPSADIHILILPKKHIAGVQDLNKENGGLLARIYTVANQLVKQYNLQESLYRIVVNGGKAQHVSHLHFHLLGGSWKKMV